MAGNVLEHFFWIIWSLCKATEHEGRLFVAIITNIQSQLLQNRDYESGK